MHSRDRCFSHCRALAELFFEPGSLLKVIRLGYFEESILRQVVLLNEDVVVDNHAFPPETNIVRLCASVTSPT